MAKQEGTVLLKGTMGDMNFYFREGEALARTAGGGFTREAIKKGDNMVRVRESNSEFAECSQVNKAFKMALGPLLSGYRDGSLHSRLMQLFLKIKDCDLLSERGKRTVQQGISVRAGQQLLTAFHFTPKRPNLFGGESGFDWETLTFKVNDFKVSEAQFPEEADYMEVTVGLIRFDFESLAYEHVFAEPLIIARDFHKDAFTIPCPDLPGGEGMLFYAVRVCFYRTVDGERHPVPESGHTGVRIMSVWEGTED